MYIGPKGMCGVLSRAGNVPIVERAYMVSAREAVSDLVVEAVFIAELRGRARLYGLVTEVPGAPRPSFYRPGHIINNNNNCSMKR